MGFALLYTINRGVGGWHGKPLRCCAVVGEKVLDVLLKLAWCRNQNSIVIVRLVRAALLYCSYWEVCCWVSKTYMLVQRVSRSHRGLLGGLIPMYPSAQ